MKQDNQPPYASLSEFEPLAVRWLLKPLIPYGMLTVMEGDPGIGKSYVAMDLAATVSVGGELPNREKVRGGQVLYLSAEDDPSYTIRPRVEAMGGNADRIRIQAQYAALDDRGLKKLRREVEEYQPTLIVVDPLYSFIGSDGDVFRPNVIRAFLAELNCFARETGAAVVVIRHLTKARADKALYRGSGSIDVIAHARSAILVGKHPEKETHIVLAHVKHNLSKKGKSLLCKLTNAIDAKVPIVEWVGTSELTADDLLAVDDGERKSIREQAMEFLEHELRNGPKSQTVIEQRAKVRGFSARTLARAKKELHISSVKGPRGWNWQSSQH